uniref:creatine kinase n=1 Tax=Ciona intestinalis TaxID=7719 RepID=F6Q9J1_CIOIN|nr:lombricine kinase-like [Ciona intestinalis]|eukprot:XP_002123194.1 lombricine kinase-like [Ciona intestinalis]
MALTTQELKIAKQSYPVLKYSNFLSKHLTLPVYAALYQKKTSNGVTLDTCIQTGVDTPRLQFGLVVGDEECYTLFKDVLYPVIKEYHENFDPAVQMHADDAAQLNNDVIVKPFDEKYVISVRIRAGRSISGFPFAPCCTRAERRKVEEIVVGALKNIDREFTGSYRTIDSMSPAEIDKLTKEHILFYNVTEFSYRNDGIARDWPDARGFMVNERNDFIVWVNEEDHVRIISMQSGNDLQSCFENWKKGEKQLEDAIKNAGYKYAWSKNLGHLCTCPSNIGTSMRCSVHVRLPNMSVHPKLDEIIKKLGVAKRGNLGEHRSSTDQELLDISNVKRLGISEVGIVQQVYQSVTRLIDMERQLEAGKLLDDVLK